MITLLYLLNKNLEAIQIIDTFKSFIWTERYNSDGDFELYIPITKNNIDNFSIGYFIQNEDSKRLMIIEDVAYSTENIEPLIAVKGRSLESLLRRRIVLNSGQISKDTFFYNSVTSLVDGNISSSAAVVSRRIPNLACKNDYSGDIKNITNNEEETHFGENLYDVIETLCKTRYDASNNTNIECGFKIEHNRERDGSNNFIFSVYLGNDYSYDNPKRNPYVVFSQKYNNIKSSRYEENIKDYKNIIYAKKKDTTSTFQVSAKIPKSSDPTGFDRYEMKSSEEYASSVSEIYQKTYEELSEKSKIMSFDGEIEPNVNFKLKKHGVGDYDLGDIVQYEFVYGNIIKLVKARISEIIYSYDETGYRIYPTFSIMQD